MPKICNQYDMKKVFFLLIAVLLVASCNDKEPFDVRAAQRQLTGKWECTEEDSGKSYEVTLSPEGVMDMVFKNLCEISENEIVVAKLLDETSLFIPPQTGETFSIEGNGTISNEYKKMILELSFNDGSGAKKIMATCNKITQ